MARLRTQPPIVLVVLDGAADRPDPELGGATPLQLAATPNLDLLAADSKGTLIEVLPTQAVPQTHSGMLSLLGYPEIALQAKRGSLEASVIFGKNRDTCLYARGNLSSIVDGKIPSRRVNRDVSQDESDALCEFLTAEIRRRSNIPFDIRSYSTYRLAVSIDLVNSYPSDRISNTDPGYATDADYAVPDNSTSFPVAWSVPLNDTPEAERSATMVNQITRIAHEILDQHPINIARKEHGRLPINHILMRDFGSGLPEIEDFRIRWGLGAKYFQDLPVELAVAKYLKMDNEEAGCRSATIEAYTRAGGAIARDLGSYDFIVFHVKGPDEPGHDGDWRKKISSIEAVDTGLFGILTPLVRNSGATLCVTSDHATCWAVGTHTADKVPLILRRSADDSSDSNLRFNEAACADGTLPIAFAWELLPLVTEKLSPVGS